MRNIIHVGILQFDIRWEDINSNISFLDGYIKSLSVLPDIFILPEMFSTGFTMNPEHINKDDFRLQKDWIKHTAKTLKTNIIGSIVDFDSNCYFNRMVLASPDSSFFQYDKRHLFRMGKENKVYTKGKERKLFNLDGLKIFPQICYDLRFPVWCRNTEGYHIIINVANWPAVRQDVWNTLLKARAIENQCYVIGVNRIGKDENGIEYKGGSVVYDAKGRKLLGMNNSALYRTVKLDITQLLNFREKFPVYKDADSFEIKNRE